MMKREKKREKKENVQSFFLFAVPPTRCNVYLFLLLFLKKKKKKKKKVRCWTETGFKFSYSKPGSHRSSVLASASNPKPLAFFVCVCFREWMLCIYYDYVYLRDCVCEKELK
jgi:hypothetical protein